MNDKNILIIIDSYNREYRGSLFLKKQLNLFGYKVYIINKVAINYAFNYYKPFLVLTPKSHKMPELEMISKVCLVGLIQAESFSGNINGIIKYNTDKIARLDIMDFVFCWGKRDYNTLTNNNIVDRNVAVKSGNPSVELWKSFNNNNNNNKTRKVIGFTTSLRALTHVNSKHSNIIEIIDNLEQNGESGFFDPPNHAENWIFLESAWIRLIINIVEKFPQYTFNIRPHLLENKEDWKYLSKKYKNVKISSNVSIKEWFKDVGAVCTYLSNSQIDAYLAKKLVINLENLFPKYVVDNIPKTLKAEFDTFFEKPKTFKELEMSFTKKWTINKSADKFIFDVFSYPYEMSPSLNIATHIKNHSRNKLSRKSKFRYMYEHKFLNFLPNFINKYILVVLYKYIKSFLSTNKSVRVSIFPIYGLKNSFEKIRK